jgi:hypothetical protein
LEASKAVCLFFVCPAEQARENQPVLALFLSMANTTDYFCGGSRGLFDMDVEPDGVYDWHR